MKPRHSNRFESRSDQRLLSVSLSNGSLGNGFTDRGCTIAVFLIASIACLQAFGAERSPRMAQVKPDDGRFVKVAAGYMIPYVEVIPGTDVSFQMVPVPANPALQSEPFWIGKHEVTMGEYQQFARLYEFARDRAVVAPSVSATDRRVDVVSAPTPVYSPRDRFAGVTSNACPAYSMTLFAAKQYTKWLSLLTRSPYRLPAEAEWEHACGAGNATNHWSEEQLRRVAIFGLETGTVQPVGGRASNAWGIHDMYGNVSEWVITRLPDGDEHRSADARTGKMRVGEMRTWPPVWISKGGNFADPLEACQLEQRFVVSSQQWEEEANLPKSVMWLGSHSDRVRIGFRVVRSLGELDEETMSRYWDAGTVHYRLQIDDCLESGRGAEAVVLPEQSEWLRQTEMGLQPWISH